MCTRDRPPVLLLDLDRTLYRPESGLQEAGDVLLTEWMAATLGLGLEETHALRRRLWAEYGTSAYGLEVEYGLPQSEIYANCIELLDPAEYLQPRPEVRALLTALDRPAWVFSNTTRPYCTRVLEALDLGDCFRGLVTIEAMGWRPKPQPEAYRAALAACGAPGEAVVLVDDSVPNLEGGQRAGLRGILCHPQERGRWSPRISDLTELPSALAEFPLPTS